MNKSLSAAITTMILVTSTAWATPESQAIRPTGDNQPDHTPTEQADQMREHGRDHANDMKQEHSKARDNRDEEYRKDKAQADRKERNDD